jgi:hypothetical protein
LGGVRNDPCTMAFRGDFENPCHFSRQSHLSCVHAKNRTLPPP